ncbi:thrombopoietin isoform X4 [Tachyglossus aculeatus]|uniref:thrombopoietin isoform X4 n=1 Tax=Tachyglossus aculeatus TaxID=9261 RepID=UPI0018F74A7F|nr:thrombopoietin isoform X4 [Tachyglossus aculeatus]
MSLQGFFPDIPCFPGADQGTGGPGGISPPDGGSWGGPGTTGDHLPLPLTWAAFRTSPPPLRGPAGSPWSPGLWPQAHPLPPASPPGPGDGSQGARCHLPELLAALGGKGAFPAARTHSLCQAGPAGPQPRKRTPQTLGREIWHWTAGQNPRTSGHDTGPCGPSLRAPGPGLRTLECDLQACGISLRTPPEHDSQAPAQSPGTPTWESHTSGQRHWILRQNSWILAQSPQQHRWFSQTLIPSLRAPHSSYWTSNSLSKPYRPCAQLLHPPGISLSHHSQLLLTQLLVSVSG